MVFQNSPRSILICPSTTTWHSVSSSARCPRKSSDEKVKAAAEIPRHHRLTFRVSPRLFRVGQRQRVALGRTIVREPKVFLLDEPLSNLDAKLRAQMRTEISKLHARLATTFIYVTHDQIEAMTMGTRIVVMKDGFMQQCRYPSEPLRLSHQPLRRGLHRHPSDELLQELPRSRREDGKV